MEISKLDLRFEVSSDNKKVVDINEKNWMLKYQTEGSFTNMIFINILAKEINTDKYVKVGILHGRYFKLTKILNKGASLLDVFDSIDQDTYMLYDALIDEDGWFNTDYCGIQSNVFYGERFFIEKAYRNKGLGEKILAQLDDVLNYSLNCDIGCYIILPNPIERIDDNNFRVIDDENIQNGLKKKLINFYKRCGYQEILDTEFMYINTDYAME